MELLGFVCVAVPVTTVNPPGSLHFSVWLSVSVSVSVSDEGLFPGVSDGE